MADTLTSLADMVKLNDISVKDAGATDIFNDAPMLSILNAVPASHGTDHKYLKESGAPVVGFRAANAGRDHTADQDTLVTINLKILDASFTVDQKLAQSPRGEGYIMARKSKRSLRAAFSGAEKQFFYGTGNDADGFAGLGQTLSSLAHAMVVTATGTLVLTSVWAIRTTPDEANCSIVVGEDGMIGVRPYFEQFILDGAGKKFPVLAQPIDGYLGMAIGGIRSVGRLCNIGTAAGKTLTDALLSDLYGLFPENNPPTHFVMNMRSLIQLQKSRTTYHPTGHEAALPQDWNGIPIILTGSLINTETALV